MICGCGGLLTLMNGCKAKLDSCKRKGVQAWVNELNLKLDFFENKKFELGSFNLFEV